MVLNRLPPSLKRVSVFEDFSERLAGILDAGQFSNILPPRLLNLFLPDLQKEGVELSRVADPQSIAAFAARSVGLEQLSVAYMINAEDFFHRAACTSYWTWPRLESLA